MPLHQPNNQNEPWPWTQRVIAPESPTAHHVAGGGRGVRGAGGDGRREVRGGRGGSEVPAKISTVAALAALGAQVPRHA